MCLVRTECITQSIVLFFCMLICGSCTFSKQSRSAEYFPLVKPNNDILVGPGTCILKTFQGTSANNSYYLSWIFLSDTDNFVFQLEASEDGRHFKPYYIMSGASSPNNTTALMHCCIDTVARGNKAYYRLKAIPQNFDLNQYYKSEYASMITASTIMLKKNQKTEGYRLLSRNH